MSTDAKRFEGPRKSYGGGWGPRKSVSQDGKPVGDLRSVLAKKQIASGTDLRTKLKPKALYTSNLASRSQSSVNHQGVNGADMRGQGRKPLKLTAPFKNSVSSAVSGSSSKSSHERSHSAPMNQTRSRSSKLPSYEEAKKISVTVPGLSRPMSEYPSHRREERLAAQIARSKAARQDTFTRGREEFLASAISMAAPGAAAAAAGGGSSHDRGERERGDRTMFGRLPPRRYPSRSPSPPPMTEYSGFDQLYPLGGGGGGGGGYHSSKVPAAPPPQSYPTGSGRQRGITTATSMIISNLSDTVSKNDVAELCSVVGSLDGVYMHAPGIAEVIFKYKDDALEAYKKYNQRNLDGQPMHCKMQPASRSRITSGYGHSYMDDYYHPSHHTGAGFF